MSDHTTRLALLENPKLQRRFWAKVKIDTPLDCWEWQGKKRRGYGRFLIDRKYFQAHRISYEMTHGPIADDLVVRHRCDNPACVNPLHLHPGTQAQNVADCYERDRVNHAHGERTNTAKLTADDVRSIRKLARAGRTHAALSRQFGTTKENIGYIVRGATWKHVT